MLVQKIIVSYDRLQQASNQGNQSKSKYRANFFLNLRVAIRKKEVGEKKRKKEKMEH